MTRMIFTLLGCGSSPGVPRIGNDWGNCDPNNPKNQRLRCSLLVERKEEGGTTCVLVDTSPDLRAQMLREKVQRLDGVLFTHPHADHIHGIDDLRGFWIKQRACIDTYSDVQTSKRLREGFNYCFETPVGSSYPPIVNEYRINAYEAFSIEGDGGTIEVLPYRQVHGDIHSLGFRIGNFAYSTDVNTFEEEALSALEGVEILVIDALRYTPHPSHFSVSEAIDVSRRIGAKRTILTHMHIDLDYMALADELPEGVEPAYDGMKIDVSVS